MSNFIELTNKQAKDITINYLNNLIPKDAFLNEHNHFVRQEEHSHMLVDLGKASELQKLAYDIIIKLEHLEDK